MYSEEIYFSLFRVSPPTPTQFLCPQSLITDNMGSHGTYLGYIALHFGMVTGIRKSKNLTLFFCSARALGPVPLSLASHTQGCCHCPHLTLWGFHTVALLLTPAPFPVQLLNSPPSTPSSRREKLLCRMNHPALQSYFDYATPWLRSALISHEGRPMRYFRQAACLHLPFMTRYLSDHLYHFPPLKIFPW